MYNKMRTKLADSEKKTTSKELTSSHYKYMWSGVVYMKHYVGSSCILGTFVTQKFMLNLQNTFFTQ